MNREQAPDIWWSPEWGLIWSDDGQRTYHRTEGDRLVEFFRLPSHALYLAYGSCECMDAE